MSFFKKFRKQFIEVIEWKENNSDRIVYQFPVEDNEIKMGAQLTVREGQSAVFVNEGQIADVFEPGRYELNTQNMPIMTTLKSWKYGFNSPFKAEVYFVNMTQFINQKWGTSNPIMLRDREFGPIRLRGYGTFAYRVSDPVSMIKEVFGSANSMNVDRVSENMKKQILMSITDTIAEMQVPALDLAMKYDEISEEAIKNVAAKFENLGFAITDLTVQNLSLPQEVEKALDKRTKMGILGNMDQYAKFQTAEAIGNSGESQAGSYANIGAGMASMGMMMNQMNNSMNSSGQGHNPQGYNPQGHNPQGYNPQGHNPQGHNPQGYNPQGYNPQSYNPQGYNPQGYNPQGHNPQNDESEENDK